jgi:hypothetical protein
MKRQMELAGTNLSDDELENMLEEGGRAKLLGHVQVPGVDVMITIFCDFRQFSAKKIGAFLKKHNVMIKILHIF